MTQTPARRGKAARAQVVTPQDLPHSEPNPLAGALPAPGCPVGEEQLATLKQSAIKKAVPRSAVAQVDSASQPKR